VNHRLGLSALASRRGPGRHILRTSEAGVQWARFCLISRSGSEPPALVKVPIPGISRWMRTVGFAKRRRATRSGGWSVADSGQPEGGRALIRPGVLAAEHARAQLGLKGRHRGALVANACPVDKVKPALERPSLYLAVTFAAVPVQDVAVNGSVCGVDQEDQHPTHDSNLQKYLNTSD
jgi:hypothetical protein